VNILVDRVMELWNGSEDKPVKKNVRVRQESRHSPSQGDYLDTVQTVFPPAPMATSAPTEGYDYMMRSGASTNVPDYGMGPMAANGVLGGAFGSSF